MIGHPVGASRPAATASNDLFGFLNQMVHYVDVGPKLGPATCVWKLCRCLVTKTRIATSSRCSVLPIGSRHGLAKRREHFVTRSGLMSCCAPLSGWVLLASRLRWGSRTQRSAGLCQAGLARPGPSPSQFRHKPHSLLLLVKLIAAMRRGGRVPLSAAVDDPKARGYRCYTPCFGSPWRPYYPRLQSYLRLAT